LWVCKFNLAGGRQIYLAINLYATNLIAEHRWERHVVDVQSKTEVTRGA
jgi:hypothetical protein